MRKKIFILLILFGLMQCTTQRSAIIKDKSKTETGLETSISPSGKRNVILLIGDGMGLTQISAGMFMNQNKLELERCKAIGIHKPYSADDLITDSAAGATAFSIGKKTNNGYLGVDANKTKYETILEEANAKGFSTGMVVSSTIVHATPAAFISHQSGREDYEAIALDFMNTSIDFMIGGGKKYFDRRNNDNINLIDKLRANDYFVTDYFEQDFDSWAIPEVKRLAYFTADGDPLPHSKGRTYLPKASQMCLDFLNKKSSKGFFAMIEGSQIDWGGHANDADYIISEVLDFNKVIKNALDFAQRDGNTLVIITADHETGGFAINPGSKMNELLTSFSSKKHSASLIPVFAYGPGAENFSGIYENTEIYHKMRQYLFNIHP